MGAAVRGRVGRGGPDDRRASGRAAPGHTEQPRSVRWRAPCAAPGNPLVVRRSRLPCRRGARPTRLPQAPRKTSDSIAGSSPPWWLSPCCCSLQRLVSSSRSPPPTAPRRRRPRPRRSRRRVMAQRPSRPPLHRARGRLTCPAIPLVGRHDHDPGHGAGFPGWTAGDLRPHPVERNRGAGRPDRRFELPELERPDRGHVQRSGGTHELSHAEHLQRHGPALRRAFRPCRSRSTLRAGPPMR